MVLRNAAQILRRPPSRSGSWGYHGRDELVPAGAAAVIGHFKELFVILEDSTGTVLGDR